MNSETKVTSLNLSQEERRTIYKELCESLNDLYFSPVAQPAMSRTRCGSLNIRYQIGADLTKTNIFQRDLHGDCFEAKDIVLPQSVLHLGDYHSLEIVQDWLALMQ